MRRLTANDIRFLQSIKDELDTSKSKNTLELKNPQDMNRLLILMSSIDWSNVGEIDEWQKAASKAEEFYDGQSMLMSDENKYISTKHPHKICKMTTNGTAIRVTFRVERPIVDMCDVMGNTNHVSLSYDIKTGIISQ